MTRPFLFFFLVLPAGISTGFASLALPFILTRAGFSVAAAGHIVALGISANFLRFVWGPVADFTLTPQRWYTMGLLAAGGALLALVWIPFHSQNLGAIEAAVLISQIATTLVLLPLGGLMAHTVTDNQKGHASGWFQAGNLCGNGVGAGAGILLTAHYSKDIAAGVISVAVLLGVLVVPFVSNNRFLPEGTFLRRVEFVAKDVLAVFRSRRSLLIVLLVCSPIGAGAMAHQWSAVWFHWHTTADEIAVLIGVFAVVAAAAGCITGGLLVDRIGIWWAYFGSGIGLALAAMTMGVAPKVPVNFAAGVLVYSFMQGSAYAAFSALILLAIGGGSASTKYALLTSLGNLPVAYMTAADGWMHDRGGAAAMLYFDSVAALVFVLTGLIILACVRPDRTRPPAETQVLPLSP